MPSKKLFKPQPEELKRGSENLPTIEEVLRHGQFLKETKYSKSWQAKWDHIANDVANKLHQIWIQDFEFPESCLRSISLTLCGAIKDQLSWLSGNRTLKPELKKAWMAKFGTIIEPFRCRCKIEINQSRSEYYHPDCQCQELHKIPVDKLEFVYVQRERSERIRQSALQETAENRKIQSCKRKMMKEAALRVKRENQAAWKESRIKEAGNGKKTVITRKPNKRVEVINTPQCSKNSIFLSQRQRQHYSNSYKKEAAEELCDDSISSPLISDIEVARNSIKIEICPDIKEERFE